MLSTLNMMNISFLKMMLEVEQHNIIKRSENNVNIKNKKS